MAIISFSGFLGIAAGGYYLYQNKDRLVQELIPIPDLPDLGGISSSPSIDAVPSAPSVPSVPGF